MTIEQALKLRTQVKAAEPHILNIFAVISGPNVVTSNRMCGSQVFQPSIKLGNNGQEAAWVWRERKGRPPTPHEREIYPDWDGISDGDPVTWGHIEALGFRVPIETKGSK